ncbi:MAG: hypothetical protein A3J74_04810 [Elusimicrobia bacterium RIFCSPHIGHO2_02_FULL_57_9]|nr:MAG: hypothetical protein A3J74_04810 [Elusimicrobia bacterium RIFCSPHIGHO2_02_FULL_57_9]
MRRPLAGKTIIVTRSQNQARPFAAELSKSGARVILAPTIRIAPPSSYNKLDAALRDLKSYDCVMFTSQNAVDHFFKRWRRLRRPQKPPKLFAVGPQTAESLRRHGWRAARFPEVYRGEALAKAVGDVRGRRILLPRAKKGREILPRLLRNAGAKVAVVEAYRNLPDARGARRVRLLSRSRKIDAVTFTSPSTVEQFAAQIGRTACRRIFRKAMAASIGPVTSKALRSYGIKPIIQAEEATIKSLLKALARALGK